LPASGQSPNLPEYAIAFHAVAMVGGINTTANPLYTADELARQLRDCGQVMKGYKKLRAVEFVEDIPKSPAGKILRRALIDRERAAAPSA
jgi:acyl-CoA synthetase (AMP-forming)/AMP-acid ligase II